MTMQQTLTSTPDSESSKRKRGAITDRGLFWRRPRAWVGGELANRLGLQPLRTLYQHLRHRPFPQQLPERLRAAGEELVETGMVVIPDFLPAEIFEQVRNEYQQAFSANSRVVERTTDNHVNGRVGKYQGLDGAVQSMVIAGARQESAKVAEQMAPVTNRHLLCHQDIWALASAAMGKKLKYQPGAYFQRESRADPDVEDLEQNIVLHEDVYYPSLKGFFYVNDNLADNGAFVVVPNSHRLDLKRLRHEYAYSVDVARQKKGKPVSHPVHPSGRMEVFGNTYAKEELQEVQAVGKANTLVLANVMAFHRRGGTREEGERCQVRMSFRHVETLHHALFPALGTPNSLRFRERSYF